MLITTNNDNIDDITKEIDAIEATIPDENIDTSKAVEIEFTGEIVGKDEPIEKIEEEAEVLPDQPEVVEEVETPTEPVQKDDKPIDFMTQLTAFDVIEDLFDRAGLVMILLGDSAKGMREHDNPFYYTPDIVHVALRDNDKEHFKRVIHSMADAWRESVTYEDHYMTFTKYGVKIIVEYVDQAKYPYFNFPDRRLWNLREVALPNPYPAYVEEFIAK